MIRYIFVLISFSFIDFFLEKQNYFYDGQDIFFLYYFEQNSDHLI